MTNCDVFELVDLRLEVPQMKSSVDFPISVKSMKLARITQLCGSKACQIGRSRVIRYSPSSFIGHYLQLRATTFIWKWETSLILSARIPTRSLNPLLWLPILALLDKSEGRDPYHWCNHHCDGKHGHNCARRVSFPANLCRFHRKKRSLELLSSQKIVNVSHPSIWRSAHSTTPLILQERQTPLVSDHSSTYLRSSGSHWWHCGSCRGDNRYLLVIISLRPPYFPLDDLGKESASNGEHWRILTGLNGHWYPDSEEP